MMEERAREAEEWKRRALKLARALDEVERIIRDESLGDDSGERITRIASVLDGLEVKT